jgi:lipoprotein-releasing system permease protein
MIIYKLRDPSRAPALAEHFEPLFQHDATSWQDREASTLKLFLMLRLSAGITVSLVILLAGFGIFNVLTMTVLAKIKEIAILQSMGYRRRDISAIFLWQGALVAVVGSLIGCGFGALLTYGISKIPIRLRGLISAEHFIVSWGWQQYVSAILLALVSVFIASYVPARRAAELPPVTTLRGSSV